jgi:hypothetical protein
MKKSLAEELRSYANILTEAKVYKLRDGSTLDPSKFSGKKIYELTWPDIEGTGYEYQGTYNTRDEAIRAAHDEVRQMSLEDWIEEENEFGPGLVGFQVWEMPIEVANLTGDDFDNWNDFSDLSKVVWTKLASEIAGQTPAPAAKVSALDSKQRKALIKNIEKQWGRIYNLGDSGLDYFDGHVNKPNDKIMNAVYDNDYKGFDNAALKKVGDRLESIADDAEMDVEF